MTVYFWFPFLPLFMQSIGATDDADAAFWVAVALTCQGLGRLAGGPLWGLVSDRVGRKKMFIRALFCAGIATLCISVIQAPWQLSLAMAMHGLLSGFNPAAIALASVLVPDNRLKSSISLVSGGQYLGNAAGPALGAVLVLFMDYRGAIAVSGLSLFVVAFAVVMLVPADTVQGARRSQAPEAGAARVKTALEPFQLTLQLGLAIVVYFVLFGLNSFRNVSTAIALKQIDEGDVIAHTGIAFALVGVASALGVLLMSLSYFRKQRVRSVLVGATAMSAFAYFLLSYSGTVPLFVAALTAVALLNAAMFPSTNSLIALNASRARRGTAFGLASGAQAMAMIAGPMAAALFAATSLTLGFALIGVALLGLAVLIAAAIREPREYDA